MDWLITGTGFLVGVLVGITGVGGGSVMTPALLMLGIPPSIAVGTDLLYASITKMGAALAHQRCQTIQWSIVIRLSKGSIPATLCTLLILHHLSHRQALLEQVIALAVSGALILTAIVVMTQTFRNTRLSRTDSQGTVVSRYPGWITTAAGAIIGVFVTLSSIGAGAIGGAALLILYPRLSGARIVATDLAHALPLAAIAGAGHFALGNVDTTLLWMLVSASLPGAWIGTRIAVCLPDLAIRRLLAAILLIVGTAMGANAAT